MVVTSSSDEVLEEWMVVPGGNTTVELSVWLTVSGVAIWTSEVAGVAAGKLTSVSMSEC